MAIYRLHRLDWDKGHPPLPGSSSAKRKRADSISAVAAAVSTAATIAVDTRYTESEKAASSSATHSTSHPSRHFPSESKKGGKDGKNSQNSKKKKDREQEQGNISEFPGGGRKGVSSGLSTVIKHKHTGGIRGSSGRGRGRGGKGAGDDGPSRSTKAKGTTSTDWWKKLGEGSGGSKGSIRV